MLVVGLAQAGAAPNPEKLYETWCQGCHGAGRLGGTGPVLLPDSLSRLKQADAIKAIADGLPATQMPGFKGALDSEGIQALAAWIYTEPAAKPAWEAKDIEASRIVHKDAMDLPAKPVFKADPSNITLVVEHGDHSITVLDGDRMAPIHRFATRYALHGGPKFTPDGRFVYWSTRDGWVTKYDLWHLKVVAEVRAGLNTRNVAVSSDGRYVMAANYLPHTLVALDARDLALVKVIPVQGKNGKTSRVSAVYDARPRASFIAALRDIPEVWEIPYAGLNPEQPRPVRAVELTDYLDDFFFDQDYRLILGASRASPKGQVVQLDAGRKIADLDMPGMPHLGSGITWEYQGRPVMASPNLKEGLVSVIDMRTWRTIKQIKTLGPGFFLRSHENTPYAWADVFSGPDKDAMQVIDKRSLEIVATLRPEPDKTSTHVEFDRYGKYALVSIWEQDGALVVYDAATLEEVKRLPMKRPVGKYNVWNKTRLSAGTSH
ncbi:MAG: c-type cytochrome [Betaproteobacteria bacterium]|nr:c-type cytochrome [Betaproteobacteria bacterium]